VHIAVSFRALTRGRPRSVEGHLSPAELDATIRRASSAGAARLVQRRCLVKNCDAGDAASEAARRVGVSSSSGARWLDRWNEAGLAGLEPDFGRGRPPKLDAGERDALQGRLGTDGPVTTAGVGELLGVEYAAGYLPRLLRAQGCLSPDPERVDLPPDASTAGRPSSDSSKTNSFSNLS
jgi:transposase